MTIQKYLNVDHCRLCKAENENNTHCYSSIPCSMGFLNNRHKLSGMFSKYLHTIVHVFQECFVMFPMYLYYNSMKKDAYDFVVIDARCDILAKRTNNDCRYIFSEIFCCQVASIKFLQKTEFSYCKAYNYYLLCFFSIFLINYSLFSANKFSDFITEETTLKYPMSKRSQVVLFGHGRQAECVQMQQLAYRCKKIQVHALLEIGPIPAVGSIFYCWLA